MRQPRRQCWSTLSILLAGLTSFPFQAGAGDDARGQLLAIEPTLCVLTVDQPHCDTLLHIRWHISDTEATTLCLYISAQRQPLFCQSSGDNIGEHRLQLALSQSTEFELRRQRDLSVLARATVTIARPLSDLRPRRRHGWGIF